MALCKQSWGVWDSGNVLIWEFKCTCVVFLFVVLILLVAVGYLSLDTPGSTIRWALLKMYSCSSKYEPWHSRASVASGSLSGVLICLKAPSRVWSTWSNLNKHHCDGDPEYMSPTAPSWSHPDNTKRKINKRLLMCGRGSARWPAPRICCVAR